MVVGDLRSVKGGAVPCFPPHYGIYEAYVQMYHEALAERVQPPPSPHFISWKKRARLDS